MGKEITLFPTYKKTENRATNYTMLIFKMLYENDINTFKEFIISIVGVEIGSSFGVVFKQQEKNEQSIPDGLISQKGIAGYIESKVGQDFVCDQIKRHLESLEKIKNVDFKFLILLGNIESAKLDIKDICKDLKQNDSILIKITSYEEVLSSLKNILEKNNSRFPKILEQLIDEYEIYLDENLLLPTWKKILDVVNCSGSLKEVETYNIYVCPNSGSSYSHKRAKFFGAYNDKSIQLVSEIEAVIEFDEIGAAKIKWINSNKTKNVLINDAKARFKNSRNIDPENYLIFLLKDTIKNVNYKKVSPGGMQGSKMYININDTTITNSNELAKKLNEKNWSRNFDIENDLNNI